MSAAWVALLAAAPSPSPSPSQGPDELQVTPGLAGFVATFAVAVAGAPLLIFMVPVGPTSFVLLVYRAVLTASMFPAASFE